MPMVVPETVTVTLTEPAAITATENSYNRLHVTAATSTVTISATGGTAPYTGTGIFTQIRGNRSVYRDRCQWLYRKPLPLL